MRTCVVNSIDELQAFQTLGEVLREGEVGGGSVGYGFREFPEPFGIRIGFPHPNMGDNTTLDNGMKLRLFFNTGKERDVGRVKSY